MPLWYSLSLVIHILLVAFWLGGMIFMAAVLLPASRSPELRPHRAALVKRVGLIFSRISWAAFLLLVLTGTINVLGRGYALSDLVTAQFWSLPYGNLLMHKLGVFVGVLVTSLVHDFWIGPRALELMEQQPESAKTQKFRKAAGWAARINLLLAIWIVYYAVRLARGG